MSSKPAPLSPNLVAVKGAAVPVVDMPARSSTPAVETKDSDTGLQPLNFRVSAAFRREFKTYAAQHDLKLNELLKRAFEQYRAQQNN
jgi:hypothetical protein